MVCLNAVVAGLRKDKCEIQQLTGTLRGLERNNMADPRNEGACPIFARFLPPSKADAPEIDGLVQIQDGERAGLKPGQFVEVTIMGADEHDLFALVDPENADF